MPLTADRAKPAVPFGGIYRLIDFALSNVVNSGYLKVVVLTQYKSHSLDRHVTQTWRMSTLLGNYVTPVPAQQRRRQALVPRQRRRDLPVAQPDQRRAARHRRRGRRRPRLPDGLLADGRRSTSSRAPACTVAGDPAADRAGRPVRRHRRRRRRPGADPRVPREADRPAGPAGRPDEVARLDGQLRLRRRRAASTRSRATPSDERLQARHGRRHRAGLRRPRRGGGLRLQGQRRARLHRPRPRLLARRRDDATPTTTRTWTSSRRCRSSTSTTSTGRSSRRHPSRCRRRSSSTTASTASGGAQLGGLPRRRHLRRECGGSVLSPGVLHPHRGRGLVSTACRSGGTPHPAGDHRQERHHPRGAHRGRGGGRRSGFIRTGGHTGSAASRQGSSSSRRGAATSTAPVCIESSRGEEMRRHVHRGHRAARSRRR